MQPKLPAGAIAGLLLLAGAAPALAGDFPKSGQTEFDTYGTWRTLASFETKTGQGGVEEGLGIMRNVTGAKPFNDVTVRCLDHWTQIGTAWAGSGSCALIDKDGDTMMTTWDSAPSTYAFVGGTGKYLGITGGGSFHPLALHDAIGGQFATVVRHTVKWEIK